MKYLQTTVISPLGKFQGEKQEISTQEDEDTLDQLEYMFNNLNKLRSFFIEGSDRTIYFSEKVIQESIVILDVWEDAPEGEDDDQL